MQELKNILDYGVMLEDEFITTYMSVIKDEGFAQYFEANQTKAEELLQKLINESTWHKEALEKILNTYNF